MTGTLDRLDDAALLRQHVNGHPDAFAELVRRHRDRLWAVALRTLGDREEAADAVQDALMSALRAADRFRGESAVTTWLHRIVVNACLDRARRRQARPTSPLPESETGPYAARLAQPSYDSDTAVTVQAALARLPAEQRVALVLLDMQGYSVAEIAAMLGVAEGTVKSRCARGRARLAVLLGHLRPTTVHTQPTDHTPAGLPPHGTLAGPGAIPSPGIPAPEDTGFGNRRSPTDVGSSVGERPERDARLRDAGGWPPRKGQGGVP